jgi:hypothetical protein
MAMKKSISSKSKWFKSNVFGADDVVYVGVDVHKKSYHVALWFNGKVVSGGSLKNQKKGSDPGETVRQRLTVSPKRRGQTPFSTMDCGK